MARVCHVSSAHGSHDIRIFVKECRSLAEIGHEVLFVAYGDSELVDNVQIVGLGDRPATRRARMATGARQAFEKARSLRADVYHLHDPELLPYAKRLRAAGAKVIFDSHEDVPAQIMSKEWIPKSLRKVISGIYKRYETKIVGKLDAVVAATPFIAQQFEGRVPKVAVVNNYPALSDIEFHTDAFSGREAIACYTGGISEARGEKVMAEAMRGSGGKLVLAGRRVEGVDGDRGYEYLGVLDRSGVNTLYGRSVVGLVLLQPLENYVTSKPIKMYEYMAAGLPVIASDFPLWRTVIEENGCGICVPPDDPDSIRQAIMSLFRDRDLAQAMGARGRAVIEEKYSWDKEKLTLCALYDDLL